MAYYKVRVKGSKKWKTIKAKSKKEAALMGAYPKSKKEQGFAWQGKNNNWGF